MDVVSVPLPQSTTLSSGILLVMILVSIVDHVVRLCFVSSYSLLQILQGAAGLKALSFYPHSGED